MTPNNKIQLLHGIGKTRARKLHFAPPENFDLSKLPIRGEKSFDISQELKKRFEDTSPQVILPFEKRPSPLPLITQHIPKPKRQSIPQKQPIIPKSPSERKPITINVATSQDSSKFAITDLKTTSPDKSAPLGAEIIPLTSTPNVISGLVTENNGSPISAAILIVRDESGIPVRALKTNKLGQFLSATPLTSGEYSIETESDTCKFKPISIEARNEVIRPIQIIGEQTQDAQAQYS